VLALLVARKQQNSSVQQAALRHICDKTKKQIIMTIFEIKRTGRLAAFVVRWKVTKGRTETESIIKTL